VLTSCEPLNWIEVCS